MKGNIISPEDKQPNIFLPPLNVYSEEKKTRLLAMKKTP